MLCQLVTQMKLRFVRALFLVIRKRQQSGGFESGASGVHRGLRVHVDCNACTLVFVDPVLCLLFANSENCALTSYCTCKCAIRGLK